VQLVVTPPAGAQYWRILRRTADAFTGPGDTGAVLVADESQDNAVLDQGAPLANGTPFFWREYDWIGGAWVDSGASVTATPAATYQGGAVDPQTLVRDRIDLGLQVEVSRGALTPASGSVQVLTAPFALADATRLPCVSVHHDSSTPATHLVGEGFGLVPDWENGSVGDTTGWFKRVSLTIAVVSQNGDERNALRRALERVMLANLPIFWDAGFVEIEFAQSDSEEFGEKNAVLYHTRGAFTCQAPAWINAGATIITSADASATTPQRTS
jgi:hypothetical protein